ncbi:hypothetical protein NU39_004055 [Salmonella enterica subsp. enterica]|nr:hypothetical protein [Salmonella enterica subsp. enterica]
MASSYSRCEKYTIHKIQIIHTVQNLHTRLLFPRSDPISAEVGSVKEVSLKRMSVIDGIHLIRRNLSCRCRYERDSNVDYRYFTWRCLSRDHSLYL